MAAVYLMESDGGYEGHTCLLLMLARQSQQGITSLPNLGSTRHPGDAFE